MDWDFRSREDHVMSAIRSGQTVEPVAIPIGEILPWAVFGGLLMFIILYLIGAEQSAVSIFSGSYIHEFVHDGRHLLGFPCH
jgi:hypothetical protein